MSRPFCWNGYEIDRKDLSEVEHQIRLYPIRKARLEYLKAKWADRDQVDYHTYRSGGGDGMPGAPGHVGDPTGNRVTEMATQLVETQNMAYLQKWVEAMDMVLEDRLDDLQRRTIREYVMVNRHTQDKGLFQRLLGDWHTTQTQAYHWMNTALLEFAFLLLDEKSIRKKSEANFAKAVV